MDLPHEAGMLQYSKIDKAQIWVLNSMSQNADIYQ